MGSVVFSSTYSNPDAGTSTYNVRIGYSEEYDAAANRTAVRISSVELQRVGNGANWGYLPFYGSVRVNGATLLSMTGGASVRVSLDGGGYCPVAIPSSSSVSVVHNDDGSKSVSFALVGGFSYAGADYFCGVFNSHPFGVTAQSQTVALTTHPRGSAIASCPDAAATNSTITLTVDRNSAAFYHKAAFKVGGTTLDTSSAFAASLNYLIPRTWFSAYSSAASLTVTVSVQTYTDSSCSTALGSPVTQTMTVNADAGMKPAVSEGWASVAYDNANTSAANINGYVKGCSKAKVRFDETKVTHAAGASAASFSVVCLGATAIASGTPLTASTPTLSAASVSVTCTVTDSRGRETSETFTVPVMDYARPRLSGISVFRCDGNGTESEDGTYIMVKATRSFSSLGGQNSCTLKAAYAASGGSYGTGAALVSGTAKKIGGGNVSPDLSYTVKIWATDALGNTAAYFASIPTRKWAMKFRANGRGVAFGKAAEADDRFEVSSDWDVKLGRPLPLDSGGTGAATAEGAKQNLLLGSLVSEQIVIPDGESRSFSPANRQRGFIVCCSYYAAGRELIIYAATNTGVVRAGGVAGANGIAVDCSVNNRLTITNSSGNTVTAIHFH